MGVACWWSMSPLSICCVYQPFDSFIMLVIVLNILTMACSYYQIEHDPVFFYACSACLRVVHRASLSRVRNQTSP